MVVYMPVVGGWTFEEGGIGEEVGELQWRHDDGSWLEVSVWWPSQPTPIEELEAEADREGEQVVDSPVIDGNDVLHTTFGDRHNYYWFEGNTEVRVTVTGPQANTILDQLDRRDVTDEAVLALGADSTGSAPPGDPITDQEFTAMFPPQDTGRFIPGSARLVASKEVPELGRFEIYTASYSDLGGLDAESTSPGTCIFWNSGGSVCGIDVSAEEFRIDTGSSCAPDPITRLAVFGLAPNMELVLEFTDDTSENIQSENGVAIWAWGDQGLSDIEVTNPTSEIEAELARLSGYWLPELPYYGCQN